mmetsp:Transcript_104853/g.281798  ORF Transcript_104853/g.281798 Transcript_104853/m.281798 type:complete len:216 (-) Transcript_104853:48-695(-)
MDAYQPRQQQYDNRIRDQVESVEECLEDLIYVVVLVSVINVQHVRRKFRPQCQRRCNAAKQCCHQLPSHCAIAPLSLLSTASNGLLRDVSGNTERIPKSMDCYRKTDNCECQDYRQQGLGQRAKPILRHSRREPNNNAGTDTEQHHALKCNDGRNPFQVALFTLGTLQSRNPHSQQEAEVGGRRRPNDLPNVPQPSARIRRSRITPLISPSEIPP